MIAIVPLKRAQEIAMQAVTSGYPQAVLFKSQIEAAIAQIYANGNVLCTCLDDAHKQRVQEALVKYPNAQYPLRFNIPGVGDQNAQAVRDDAAGS